MRSMAERRFRVRWWYGLIVVVVCLPLSGLVIAKIMRETGKAQYEAAVEARRAIGRPATVTDIIALAPAVQPELQEAWYAWQEGYLKLPHTPVPFSPRWSHYIAGAVELPSEIHAWVQGRREVFARARVLVRNSNLVISGFGYVAADLPPHRRGIADTAALRLPNLLVIREFAHWLSYESVMAKDPIPVLKDFDALLHALDNPLTLIDAMIAVSVSDIRDAAIFTLAWRGRLPAEYCAAWLREAPNHLFWVARGLESEIALHCAGMANSLDKGDLLDWSLPRAWWISLSGWRLWSQGYSQCANSVGLLGAWCDRLESRRPDTLPLATHGVFGPGILTIITIPNFTEAVLVALENSARHRQIRLAVRLLSLPASELPADGAELERLLDDPTALNAGGDSLVLTYERLAPDRFRLSVDPLAAGPNIVVDPGRIVDLGKPVGTSASTEPYVFGSAMVEVQVPNLTAAPETAPSPPPAP